MTLDDQARATRPEKASIAEADYAQIEMDVVKLTVVGNEIEAEMLCGLLRSHGFACNYRKTNSAAAISAESGGFTIAGPTEVLVHDSDLDRARTLLKGR